MIKVYDSVVMASLDKVVFSSLYGSFKTACNQTELRRELGSGLFIYELYLDENTDRFLLKNTFIFNNETGEWNEDKG